MEHVSDWTATASQQINGHGCSRGFALGAKFFAHNICVFIRPPCHVVAPFWHQMKFASCNRVFFRSIFLRSHYLPLIAYRLTIKSPAWVQMSTARFCRTFSMGLNENKKPIHNFWENSYRLLNLRPDFENTPRIIASSRRTYWRSCSNRWRPWWCFFYWPQWNSCLC